VGICGERFRWGPEMKSVPIRNRSRLVKRGESRVTEVKLSHGLCPDNIRSPHYLGKLVPRLGTSLLGGATDISRYYSSLSAHSSSAQAQLAIQVCLISAELWRFYHLSNVGFSDSDSPARCMHS